MVWKAKDLLKRKGILSSPNPKPCHVLATEAADHVWIYECDESKSVGCCLVKKTLSNKEGKWVHIKKRHWATSETFISHLRKVSYSECWLLQVCRTLSKATCFSWGKWYTCSVCLHNPPRCQANDVGWKLAHLTLNDDIPLTSYDHCLPQVVCNHHNLQLTDPPLRPSASQPIILWTLCVRSWKSYFPLRHCKATILFWNGIKMWLTTRRVFGHGWHFRELFYRAARCSPIPQEYFTSNHTPICYMNAGELYCLCYVIISDCLHHDTMAVHQLFQRDLFDYLRERLATVLSKTVILCVDFTCWNDPHIF